MNRRRPRSFIASHGVAFINRKSKVRTRVRPSLGIAPRRCKLELRD